MQIIVSLWASLMAVEHASAAQPESRLAVVIANSKYGSLGELKNPTQDGQLVSAALRSAGFRVLYLHDLDDRQFRAALRQLAKDSAGHDATLVYYAGHGVQVAGTNYLVPIDMPPPEQEEDIRLSSISADDVLSVIKSPYKVLILDACRDNPILGRALSRGRGVGYRRGLAAVAPPSDASGGVFIAYSTQADALAMDGDGAYSPFAESFAKYAGTSASIDDMFALVTREVLQKTRGAQRPFKYASLDEVFCLTGACATTDTKGQIAATAPAGGAPELHPSATEVFARLAATKDAKQRAELEQSLWEQLRASLPENVVYGTADVKDGKKPAFVFQTATARSDGHSATATTRTGQLKDHVVILDEGSSAEYQIDCERQEYFRTKYREAGSVVFLSQAQREAERKKLVPWTVLVSLENALCDSPLRLTPLWGINGIEWLDIGTDSSGAVYRAAPSVRYIDPRLPDVSYLFYRYDFTHVTETGDDIAYGWLGINCRTKQFVADYYYMANKKGEVSRVWGIKKDPIAIAEQTPVANAYVLLCEQPRT